MSRQKSRNKPRQWYDRKLTRASRHGSDYSNVDPELVYMRDKWTCKLCNKPIPQDLLGRETPKSPTLDHIVPVSIGGSHSYENLQAAHRSCNMRKANKVTDS